jgi:hypothetical protein
VCSAYVFYRWTGVAYRYFFIVHDVEIRLSKSLCVHLNFSLFKA